MAQVFYTNGTTATIAMSDLPDFQKAVEGYVEIAGHSDDGDYILVNEEGLVKGLPANPFWPWLVGNVVVASPEEFN